MKDKLITIRISKEEHLKIKQYCIDNQTTISKLLLEFVYTKLQINQNVYTNKIKRIDNSNKCIDKSKKRIDNPDKRIDNNKEDIKKFTELNKDKEELNIFN